ncbi:hypothetical protein TNCV_3935911 [Trichonephila clavipes]|nr:hypothetical protein TNCV_3935911 [Trichonephila clavipes]
MCNNRPQEWPYLTPGTLLRCLHNNRKKTAFSSKGGRYDFCVIYAEKQSVGHPPFSQILRRETVDCLLTLHFRAIPGIQRRPFEPRSSDDT